METNVCSPSVPGSPPTELQTALSAITDAEGILPRCNAEIAELFGHERDFTLAPMQLPAKKTD